MPPSDLGLDTTGAAALLQQRFSLEVERHNEGACGRLCCSAAARRLPLVPHLLPPPVSMPFIARPPPPADIQHTEARLRSALKDLEIVRAEETRVLAQRTAALRREHEGAMQALERRFLADAEALQVGAGRSVRWGVLIHRDSSAQRGMHELPRSSTVSTCLTCAPPLPPALPYIQVRLKEGVDRVTALCQAAIDAKARQLLGGLAMAVGGSVAAGGAAPAAATFGWPPAAAAAVQAGASLSPQSRRPRSAGSRSTVSGMSPPVPPAVAAANEAIAAMRAQLPPSPAKLRASSSPARPAIKLTATSGSAAAGLTAAPAPRAVPAAQRCAAVQGAPAPPGLPNTTAAAAAALRQPAAKPAGLRVRFAAEPAGTSAPQPAAQLRQASSSDSSSGRERGGLIAHQSSSEFDGELGSTFWMVEVNLVASCARLVLFCSMSHVGCMHMPCLKLLT